MRYSIQDIARVITEDPDILTELDSSMDNTMDDTPNAPTMATQDESDIDQDVTEPEDKDKPLTDTEVEKKAEEATGDNPDQQIKDQIKAQEEAMCKQEMERKKLIQPQMQELQSSMNQLGTGITKGIAAAQQGSGAFQGLDDNMSAIQAIIANLEKQFL